MKRILLLSFTFSFVFVLGALAQRTVSGNVTDDNGETVPGINVVLKGTTTGTTTDLDGNYRVSVPEDGGTLVFSFIGLATQEVEIGARSVIDLAMAADVQQLTEVVVTGYAEQDVRGLTGSVVTVDSEAFEQRGTQGDVGRLLQGSVAGLQSAGSLGAPGSTTQVRIRGIGSALASAEPLYVIDGIPLNTEDRDPGRTFGSTSQNNPLNQINPNDIESVVVLKDAAATSIYGSRGSNGVILITTKSGKAGKTVISANAQYGWSERGNYNYKILNAQQYVALRTESYLNGGQSIEEAALNAGSDTINTDWTDELFRTGRTQSYNISASGGTEKTSFFVSGSYFQQEGIVIRTDLDRITGRVNIEHRANDKLTFGTNLNTSLTRRDPVTNSSTFNNPILQAMLLDPNAPILNEDGSYFTDFNSILGGGGFNPVAIDELDTRYEKSFRVIGKVFAAYEIIEGLTFRTDFSVDLFDEEELVFQNTTYGDGRQVSGRATPLEQRSTIWQSTNALTYAKTFGGAHNVTGIGVVEAIGRDWSYSESSITNFSGNDLIRPDNGASPESISGTGTESSLLSFLGIARYDYNGKYFASASIRRDGSSRFGEDVRFGNFWSVGASWLLSEESFLKGVRALSALKLRGSYGTTGNEALISSGNQGDFRSQALFSILSYNGSPAFQPAQIANPQLTWEVKKKANIGLDFSLFRTRVGGTVDVYREETSDLIFSVPVSSVTGFTTVTTNAASMVNRGLEFSFNTLNVDAGDFQWRTSFNIAFNENEVLDLGGEEEVIDGTKNRTIGHDWQEYFLAEYAGVDPGTGRPLWYDEDGNVTDVYSADLRTMTGKSASPDFFGGLTNTLVYKGFDFSFQFNYQFGGYVYNNWAFVYLSNGGFMGENQNSTALDRWQYPGDMARNPIRGNGSDARAGVVDTGDLYKSDFVRLRNVQIGYTFPSAWMSKLKLANARVYVQSNNTLTFTPYQTGMDPEQQISGVEDFTYPPARTLSIGLDISF